MIKATKLMTAILAGALAASGAIAMTGCDAVTSTVSQVTGMQIGTTKNTDTSDRRNYGVVEDINGNKYTTVLYLQEPGSTSFSVETMKQILNNSGINWYQLVTSSAMGTDTQEYGMLYFPASATFTDIQKVNDALSGTYDCHIMTVPEYDQYLADAPSDQVYDIKIYGAETTHFGPAAQASEEGGAK